MKRLFIITVLLSLFLIIPAEAAEPNKNTPVEYEKGIVLSVSTIDASMQKEYLMGQGQMVTAQLTSGPEAGKVVTMFNYISGRSLYEIQVNAGDKIIIAISQDLNRITYHVSDFDRFDYVYWLTGLFVLTLLACGAIVGVKSVAVIAFSTLLIFKVFVSQVIAASINITLLTFMICALIAVVTQVTISGWTVKTWAAILGTIGGLAVAAILSTLSITLMHLTGLDSEEAIMLKAVLLPKVDFQGVLFAGMVFGALGAVMDVTISIASALFEVKLAQPTMNRKDLFLTGMNVGRDIMGTMSNTLILAYTGSALPLLILIAAQPQISMLKILNLNMIATEFARTLTGSIGLICAIPLTAVITAFLLCRPLVKKN